jgi:hypothetical protein
MKRINNIFTHLLPFRKVSVSKVHVQNLKIACLLDFMLFMLKSIYQDFLKVFVIIL